MNTGVTTRHWWQNVWMASCKKGWKWWIGPGALFSALISTLNILELVCWSQSTDILWVAHLPVWYLGCFWFFFILLTHKGSHREGYDYFNRQIKTVCTDSQNNQTKHKLFWQNPVKIMERFHDDRAKIYSAVRQAKNIDYHRSEDPDSIISAIVDFIKKMLKVKCYYFVK